jgi:3',5'-cyclic AMP phosphodiesterase CpdA
MRNNSAGRAIRCAAHGSHQAETSTRRDFLKRAVAPLFGTATLSLSCALNRRSNRSWSKVRFGLVTDCHYADAEPGGSRFYRHSLDKLAECVALMNAERVDFLIELGDFKDQGRPPAEETTLSYLREVEKMFQRFKGPTYHVLGNHDMDSISKPQFLACVRNTGIESGRTYYSFDIDGLHCVVLDANYTAAGADYDHGNFNWTDANIPPQELDWLRNDLAVAAGPVVVFIHQLLDGIGSVYVKNAAEVRRVLETAGNVLAVFQGHHHAGSYHRIGGIHYYTLKALVEGPGLQNNAYALVELDSAGNITVTGCRNAATLYLPV